MLDELDRLATLLSRHRTTPETWIHGGTPEAYVRRLIRLHATDEAAFWKAMNAHPFWGGIGSVANQSLNANPGYAPEVWDREIRELRGLLTDIGTELMARGNENPDISYWLAAFHHWSQSEL